MLKCPLRTLPHLPRWPSKMKLVCSLSKGPLLRLGSVPFTGHYSLHFDAFHHPLGDIPPALPARTLRKVMYLSHGSTISSAVESSLGFLSPPPFLPERLAWQKPGVAKATHGYS